MDKREAILARIAEITVDAKTGAGLKACVRNRGLMGNDKRPACVLLDGDERPGPQAIKRQGREMAGMGKTIMRMVPELYILMDEKRPVNDDLGTELNAKRVALVKAIALDETLKDLLGSNGGIIYTGCVTDLKSGSTLTGQMRIDFIFSYVFDPTA